HSSRYPLKRLRKSHYLFLPFLTTFQKTKQVYIETKDDKYLIIRESKSGPILILIIFFGLVIVGIFNFKFLMKNKKITFKNRPGGYVGSFIIGMAFSLGWTPCTGPILAIVLSLAATNPDVVMIMMISYVLGFSIPFLLLALFIGKIKWIKKHSLKLIKIGGYIMIFMGVALFFDWLTKLTSFLAVWFLWILNILSIISLLHLHK
ncbi:cytochrome c biogenesis CcdA family protein, partial [Aliibacillus thermotolerans]